MNEDRQVDAVLRTNTERAVLKGRRVWKVQRMIVGAATFKENSRNSRGKTSNGFSRNIELPNFNDCNYVSQR